MAGITIEFVADRGDGRRRLDQVLVRHATSVSAISRSRAQSWITNGLVTLDGIPATRASARVREGVRVVIALPPETHLRQSPRAQPLPLDVLYEDDDLLAVSKPAGMVSHPSYRNPSATVINAVLWHCRHRKSVRPGLVSRLDKYTSGVLLVALGPGAHAKIQRDATAGRLKKEYIAVVRGTPRPGCGTIALPLQRDPDDRRRMIVKAAGFPSETHYRVLSSHGNCAVVACELMTGRTHQIRVHLAARGWPVVGDEVYGCADAGIARQALHAWRVSLAHPRSRQPLVIEAPLPDDMQKLAGLAV